MCSSILGSSTFVPARRARLPKNAKPWSGIWGQSLERIFREMSLQMPYVDEFGADACIRTVNCAM